MAEAPRVLVVTSAGSPPAVVTPVLAALEAHGLAVRAIDVGRVGARSPGAAWRVLRAVVGELAERRLMRELEQHPPDVALAFDPSSAAALAAVRDESTAPAPVVALVPELEPTGDEWAAAAADRYLTVDDAAACALSDAGVDGARVLPVGPFCPLPYAQAGRTARAELRTRFKLPDGAAVILVEVAGLGYDTTSQLALQLSLSSHKAIYLFAAGDDIDAATALRRQVPTLGLKAKLFGNTADAPLLWRAADVVVARPRAPTVAKAMAVGARLVAFAPDDGGGKALVAAIEARRLGIGAQGPLFVSSALEALLAASATAADRLDGEDGAANTADVVWLVGAGRREIIAEARASERAETSARVEEATRAARSTERETSAAGDLEDLGWDGDDASDGPAAAPGAGASATRPPEGAPRPPDRAEIERLRRDLDARVARAQRTISDAQQAAGRWDKKVGDARRSGAETPAREAERNADLERARMHAALKEMAELTTEREALDRAAAAAASAPPPPRASASGARPSRAAAGSTGGAPSVDDLLRDLKKQGGGDATRPSSTVDDELEALKRKMTGKKRGKS